MRKREQEKLTKYEDTLSELRSAGWDPELHVIILGTLGERYQRKLWTYWTHLE